MIAVKACAVGVICSICALLLRELGWKGVPVFVAVCALAIISFIFPQIRELTGGLSSALNAVGASGAARSVLKIIGVGYLCGVCADVCSDIGAERVGSAVVLAGRIEIILIAMPYVAEMLKLGLELIE